MSLFDLAVWASVQSVGILSIVFVLTRWRKPTPAWSSWSGSSRRLKKRPPGPTPPAGNCRGSWTTPPKPVRDWVGRSTRSRTASGRSTLTCVDRKNTSQCLDGFGWVVFCFCQDKLVLQATVEQCFAIGRSQNCFNRVNAHGQILFFFFF